MTWMTTLMTDALLEFNIDVKRLPLGALDLEQVHRGATALEEFRTCACLHWEWRTRRGLQNSKSNRKRRYRSCQQW